MDERKAALSLLESGTTAIVPGDIAAHELVRCISGADSTDRMPPADSGKELTPAQQKLLALWIAEGAKYDQHWASVSQTRSEIPAVKDNASVRNEIDRFVLARLESLGRTPAMETSRETLLRRLAFNLTGSPPSLQEMDGFLADNAPDAYEKMVDYYLASPAYGEQMARHWLDLARYADSNGYQYDTER